MYKFLFLIFLVIFSITSVTAKENSQAGSVALLDGKVFLQHKDSFEWITVSEKMPLYLYDTLRTDPNSYVDIVLLNGSHIALNENTFLQFNPTEGGNEPQNIIVKTGTIWANFTKQEKEVQLHTNTGSVVIKGTEFVIEEKPEKQQSVVSVLDGQVAFRGKNKKEVNYNGGDKVSMPWKDVPVIKHYEKQVLRKECENNFQKLAGIVSKGLSLLSYTDVSVPYGVYLAVEFVENPNNTAISILESNINNYIPGPFGIKIPSGDEKKPDFPYNISPDQSEIGDFLPVFTWDNIDDAKSYWIFLSKEESMKELIWNKRVNENKAYYTPELPKLLPEHMYYWRIVAIDDKDKPLGKASQSYFIIKENFFRGLYPYGEVTFDNETLPFYWTKDKNNSYLIRISDKKDMKNTIVSDKCQKSKYFLSGDKIKLLTFGKKYYWQIQGIDENNNPLGKPSDVMEFIIRKE